MKIKNLFVLASLILLGTLSTGFVRSSADITTPEKGGESFAEFLSHFEKVKLPFEIGLDDLKGYEPFRLEKKKNKTLTVKEVQKSKLGKVNLKQKSKIQESKYLPESKVGKFSRGGGPSLNPVARFYPNEKTVAVIYTSRRTFSSPLYESYHMVTYDLKGNVIKPKGKKFSKKKKGNKNDYYHREVFTVADASSIETTTCRIDKQGRIWINTYDNIWKENLQKTSYHENQLINFKLKDTAVFQIGKDGLAVKLKSIPTDARASLN